MIVFLTSIVFSATTQPVIELKSSNFTRESLTPYFPNKENFLDACIRLVGNNRLPKFMEIWRSLNSTYGAEEDCAAFSMGYKESRGYEFFYVLCCLSIKPNQEFLTKFEEFYAAVLQEKKTEASASFLMVCAVLENNPVEALKLMNAVIQTCEDPDPLILADKLIRGEHNLPHVHAIVNAEDRETVLIKHLQALAAANSAQSDQPE